MRSRSTLTFRNIPKQKQQHILDTATHAFAAHGYHAVSINTIAKDAGISIGSMYSYFPSKEDLFLTVILYGQELLTEALGVVVGTEGSFIEKYRKMLEVSIAYANEYPSMNQIYIELTTEGLKGLAEELSRTIEQITIETYAELIEIAKEDGTIRTSVQPAVLAFCMDSIAMALQFSQASHYYRERYRLYFAAYESMDPEEMIDAVIELFQHGILNDQ